MFAQFVDTQLAGIAHLDELKVMLAALRLFEQKGSPTAMITAAELLTHSAVRDGLALPGIQLRPALQLAVAHDLLIELNLGGGDAADTTRYMLNTAAARALAEQLGEAGLQQAEVRGARQILTVLAREIERLEALEVYAPAANDLWLIDEWLGRGYTEAELLTAIRSTLRDPRPKGAPARGLSACAKQLLAAPPAAPSEYFGVCVAHTAKPSEEIVNARLRLKRDPNAREFKLLRTAVAIYGQRATIDALGRLARAQTLDLESLLPTLAEAESAALAMAQGDAAAEAGLREAMQLYERMMGAPPTSAIANDIAQLYKEAPDLTVWHTVFDYAARRNKKSWAYIKKILNNPSPAVFAPDPVNDAARLAFEQYRRRVNSVLDATIAGDINAVAAQVTDAALWRDAFDKAAAANALRWDYIKSVLTKPVDKLNNKDGAGKASSQRTNDGKRNTGKRSTFRRSQVEYTDEQRRAAEERARRQLEAQDDD
jgi:hypothetical protein